MAVAWGPLRHPGFGGNGGVGGVGGVGGDGGGEGPGVKPQQEHALL